jgi:hypothetical protein
VLIERQVCETVSVIREEDLFAGEIRLDGLQPLADVGPESRIDEGDVPVFDVAVEKAEILAAVGQHEVVGDALVVIQEISLDDIRLVPETEDEVAVTVMRVILHHVPENRPITDGHQRLRDVLGVFSQSHTESTAEQHDLHGEILDRTTTPDGMPDMCVALWMLAGGLDD